MPRPNNPNLRDDVLKAALKLLATHGSPSFSMRELAGEVDYAVTAVYRVFDGRGDLLRAMQLQLFETLQYTIYEHISPTATPREQIQAVGAAFLTWGIEHPAEYRLMFFDTTPDALLNPDEQAIARAPLRGLEGLLRLGNEQDDWSVGDPGSAALGLFATLHGLLSLHLAQRLEGPGQPNLMAFYEQWADHWLSALTATSSDEANHA